MTPKKEAKNLVNKLTNEIWYNESYTKGYGVTGWKTVYNKKQARQCALITVNKIINIFNELKDLSDEDKLLCVHHYKQVKNEIKSMKKKKEN